jgi:ABC-type glutathione transport system ATPase component
MNKNWNLPKVREKLSSLIKDDFVFLLPDGFAIDHLEEEIFSLEGILNGDKIQIHQKQLMQEMNIPNNNIITSDTSIKKNIKNNCDNNIIYNKKELQKETKLMNNIDNKNKNDIEKSNNNNKQLKNLIQECKKLDNIGNLEIYLYPNYKFSSSEIKNSINFMVVGQTGSGKTTLLNAFLNYLLGVKFEDNFRFKLIHEDFGISMAESQTRDVIIYNI